MLSWDEPAHKVLWQWCSALYIGGWHSSDCGKLPKAVYPLKITVVERSSLLSSIITRGCPTVKPGLQLSGRSIRGGAAAGGTSTTPIPCMLGMQHVLVWETQKTITGPTSFIKSNKLKTTPSPVRYGKAVHGYSGWIKWAELMWSRTVFKLLKLWCVLSL